MEELPAYKEGDEIFKYKLMLKQHYETGVGYLCITKKEDYKKYRGSGKVWKLILKKYKSKILTTLLYTSDDLNRFNSVCYGYSLFFDVVNSDIFANLVHERGYTDQYHNYDRSKTDYTKSSKVGGLITKNTKVGIFDPELQHLRHEWALIGAKALEESGNRKGCTTKEWQENNKDLALINAAKGGRVGGKTTGAMFWWNNGVINKKSFDSPGDGWIRGMLMSEKKKAQVYKAFGPNHIKGKKINE